MSLDMSQGYSFNENQMPYIKTKKNIKIYP